MDESECPAVRDDAVLVAVTERLTRIEQRLERLQELVSRSYDDTQRAAALVLAARREPGYDDAYGELPLVTVRIGTRGGDNTIFEHALRTVRAQHYPNWEAVIVCDGQDERMAAAVADLSDSRIRFRQRPRNGPYPEEPLARWRAAGSHPFNEAVALARGAWIAPIDDDDEWNEDHLEVLLAAARSTRAELVYGVARVLVEGAGETFFGAWPPVEGDFGFQCAIYHAGLSGLLYDVNSHLVDETADWHLARRMLEAGVRCEFVDRVVTTYRVESTSAGAEWWGARIHGRGAHRGGAS